MAPWLSFLPDFRPECSGGSGSPNVERPSEMFGWIGVSTHRLENRLQKGRGSSSPMGICFAAIPQSW